MTEKQRQTVYGFEAYHRKREMVLLKIGKGKIQCENCGCTDKRFIEINHINGGGRLDVKKYGGNSTTTLLNAILNETRKVNDLNLLCRVCNALHYLELMYGKLPYNVEYLSN